ncbi:hypothetical protein DERP_010169 [Dermatophagoides pteronyssinus]|uniref:Uncharacterized protein n=1 Tax=Dermatophagoides pteronyssinus TaxID=6956 RepID=A0ABQ8J6Y2_DERPT|nr:hypothetical protein DERP_010169 [Dermatophagoides pteronyssinus]
MISINRLIQMIIDYNSIIIIQIYLSFIIHVSANVSSVCKTTDYKYDFTECDEFGGKWRVMVPNQPSNHCLDRLTYVPTRIHNCYTSCEGGQFFNKSSLFCEDCQPGHYSLSGGIVFDNFKSFPDSLPDDFHIKTEYRGHENIAAGQCSGWHVDNTTGNLILRIDMKQANANSGCISIFTYTAKVVKRGRLRFTYHYKTPNNMPLSLLFTFNYRLYDGIGVIENDIDTNIKFPMTTMEKKFETIELQLQTPGLYIFTWKSIVIKNFRNYFSVSNMMNFDNYGQGPINFDSSQNSENPFQNMLSTIGIIRIERIIIEGVAYASECTPCESGTYAPESGMKECLFCPQNTAFNGSGAIHCTKCDPITEFAMIGSIYCSKRPICGMNDLYVVPKNECDPHTLKQEIEYRWIEPRICVDSNHVFPRENNIINCTLSNHTIDCDLGMEIKSETNGKFCQFCPEGYYRDEKISECQPCPPMTNPYYALSIHHWNNSLPGWSSSHHSNDISNIVDEDLFTENSVYLNSYFSRQCFRGDDDNVYNVNNEMNNNDNPIFDTKGECISNTAWQPFNDYIRTGASAPLNAYLILSLIIPYFRTNEQSELTFDFELNCNNNDNNNDYDDDQCLFMFVETRSDESDLQSSNEKDFIQQNKQQSANDINANRSNSNKKKYFSFSQQTINQVIKEWTQSTDTRTVFRHQIRRNISRTFSWIFKRTTSFQSYAKIYSLLLTGSIVGSAIRCQICPTMDDSSMACISCPNGQYLHRITMNKTIQNNCQELLSMNNYRCENCPENHILNNNNGLAVGIESCMACGENLQSDNQTNICFSNGLVTFDHNDHYDLRELEQPIIYKGINLFTSGGTQYMNIFKISLFGHRKHDPLSTCLNNITVFADDSSGVRSFICRSTIIPDGSKIFSAQSASLGDELLLITRQTSYANISIHEEFLKSPDANKYDKDFHLYFVTKSPTTACITGRKLTITMRCKPGKMTEIRTPNSCPDGTCNGCDFHLLIETGTAAACRLCRPYSNDYETVIGECIDGSQKIHYVNPKGCVMKKFKTNDTQTTTLITNKLVLNRTCSLLLPKQVQIGIAMAMVSGLFLLLLVFYFWNKNRSLEYKYTKLIENTCEGKGNEDDDEMAIDNCCVEDVDYDCQQNEDKFDERKIDNDNNRCRSNRKSLNNNHNRLDKRCMMMKDEKDFDQQQCQTNDKKTEKEKEDHSDDAKLLI